MDRFNNIAIHPDFSYKRNNNKAYIAIVCMLLLGGVGYLIYYKTKPKKEKYRSNVNLILAKKCNLSLPDYITILNETSNLQLISLQELCQTFTCNVEHVDITKVSKMINTVPKKSIVKCLHDKDWFRLALINLKIYDIINLFDDSFNAKRALTNGVYGAEYINIARDDLTKILKYVPKHLDATTAKDFAKRNGFDKMDEDYLMEYTNFILAILPQVQNLENDVNNRDITPYLFSVITTIRIGEIIFFRKSEC